MGIFKTFRRLNPFEKAASLAADYKAVFGGPPGERVLHDLMVKGHIHEITLDTDSATLTAFREGRRSLVLEIVEQLRRDPKYLASVALTQRREEDLAQYGETDHAS